MDAGSVELIEHAFYSLAHRAGTAHIVFDILGTVSWSFR